MPHLKLEKSRKYRVLIDAYKNPFAGLQFGKAKIAPTLPVRLDPGGQQPFYPLKRGDVLTFVDTRPGWGSDPGLEPIFETEEGLRGALIPAGVWGDVDDRVLAAI